MNNSHKWDINLEFVAVAPLWDLDTALKVFAYFKCNFEDFPQEKFDAQFDRWYDKYYCMAISDYRITLPLAADHPSEDPRGGTYPELDSKVTPVKILEWGKMIGVPIDEAFLAQVKIIFEKRQQMKIPTDSVPLQSAVCALAPEDDHTPDGDEVSSQEQESFNLSWLSTSHIDDEDFLKLIGPEYDQAVKLYGALFAGIIMGIFGKEMRKDDLENALKKVGFSKDRKIKTDDFKKIWKAVPQALKNSGRPTK